MDKSVGVAFALTFFFGPFGLFYVTVPGPLIMILVTVIIGMVTIGFGLLITWPIPIIWSVMVAGRMHQEFETWKIAQVSGRGYGSP